MPEAFRRGVSVIEGVAEASPRNLEARRGGIGGDWPRLAAEGATMVGRDWRSAVCVNQPFTSSGSSLRIITHRLRIIPHGWSILQNRGLKHTLQEHRMWPAC